MNTKAIALYVALALSASWILQIIAIKFWGLDTDVTRAVFVGVMWSPTILALAFIALVPAARTRIRWRIGRPGYLPLGIAIETIIAFTALAAFIVAGFATSGWFVFGSAGVDVSGGPWLLGTGFQGWPMYALNIAVTAIAFSAIGLIASTGEEFAWRGFLQSHLEVRCGVLRGLFVLAGIWWAWHLPGLLAGYNFPKYPYLGALVLFPLQMIGTSLFFGWLTIRAGSFWPAALSHAAVNSTQQGVLDNLQLDGPHLYVDIVRTGLILFVGVICGFALRHDVRR